MAKYILIVEDDTDLAAMLGDLLEASGFHAVLAANGLEAIEHLRRGHHPDLILLDMMMPVMDGWQFQRERQRMAEVAGVPVVVLTADGNARRKASAIGAQGYLSKPVSGETLVSAVERVCGPPELS
ncbi:MAG: response regulator [Deltaproteobacteria bacterium]|nr:response regulator [Deltaproteobacteria bacterium]